MNRKLNPKRIEIGQRFYHAILTICLTLIILAISTLAVYAIYKVTNGATSFNKKTSKYGKVYNISAILSPKSLLKRGIPQTVINQKREVCLRYIARNKALAKGEEEQYGIPVEITLAQALLESDAGQSPLARKTNNHFGIKCFSRNCKKGHCTNYTDDSHKDFFRVYSSIEESYRAHSLLFLKDRYKALFNLSSDDIKGWAEGLQKAGYATDTEYGKKVFLISKWVANIY